MVAVSVPIRIKKAKVFKQSVLRFIGGETWVIVKFWGEQFF